MDPCAEAGPADDSELLQRLAQRPGDAAAYATLWQRHAGAARRLASQLVRPADVDDLVSEAFLRVLRVVRRGQGPQTAFRAYLFQTMRRLAIDGSRAYYSRVELVEHTDDVEHADAERTVASADDTYTAGVDARAAWAAWRSLSEPSRTVLWHVVVQEQPPRAVAQRFGVTANSVAKRASRAREELRVAFLDQHIARTADDAACRAVAGSLAAHVRRHLGPRERARVRHHLRSCARCTQVVAELRDINATIRAVVAPLLLGGAAVAAVSRGAAHRAAAAAFKLRRTGTGWAATHTVAAGTALGAAAAVTGAVLVLVPGARDHTPATRVADPQPRAVAPTVRPGAPLTRHRHPERAPAPAARPAGPAVAVALVPNRPSPVATPATPTSAAPSPAAAPSATPSPATSPPVSATPDPPTPSDRPVAESARIVTVRVPTPHAHNARVHLWTPPGWRIASTAADGVVHVHPRRPRAVTLSVDAPFVDVGLEHLGAGPGRATMPATMRVAVIVDGVATVTWVPLG